MLPEENKIYLADCLKFLKTMPDKSVDLFILDPPYYKVVSQEWDKQWFTIEEYINLLVIDNELNRDIGITII